MYNNVIICLYKFINFFKALMFLQLIFFLLLANTTKDEIIKKNLVNQREKELNFCSRQFIAIRMLKKCCELFWKQAKRSEIFRKTLLAEVGRLELHSDKKLYYFWRDYVISLAKGQYIEFSIEFLKTKAIIEKNVQDFYAIMQAISQRLDFSNPINEPLIMSLVYDISKSLGILDVEHPFRLPPLDSEKTDRIFLKAKKYEEEMKKYNYDTFKFEEATLGQMNLLKERIEILIYDRNLIDFTQNITNEDLCEINRVSAHYLYNPRPFNGTRCNKEYYFCTPVLSYNIDYKQSSNGIIFRDS